VPEKKSLADGRPPFHCHGDIMMDGRFHSSPPRLRRGPLEHQLEAGITVGAHQWPNPNFRSQLRDSDPAGIQVYTRHLRNVFFHPIDPSIQHQQHHQQHQPMGRDTKPAAAPSNKPDLTDLQSVPVEDRTIRSSWAPTRFWRLLLWDGKRRRREGGPGGGGGS
jgi:hypothetical protein